MRFIRLSRYFVHYSSLATRPSVFHFFLLVPNMVIRGPIKSLREFLRFVAANKLPGSITRNGEFLPEIELMVCAVQKDFHLLERCIRQAIKHSANPIGSVNVIVPRGQVESCKTLISKFLDGRTTQVRVLNEESLISEHSRELLRQALGNSYGWGLQQFLTVAFVLASKSEGVLAVNADTIILRRRTWLNMSGRQEVLVSSEYHRPYYEVLKKINSDLSKIEYTFICHQMLFQPHLLKEYLSKIHASSVEQFIDITLSKSDCSVRSPFCIEFEFYAQSLYEYDRELMLLLRFGNITYKFDESNLSPIAELSDLERRAIYNSLSQHSWLDN